MNIYLSFAVFPQFYVGTPVFRELCFRVWNSSPREQNKVPIKVLLSI